MSFPNDPTREGEGNSRSLALRPAILALRPRQAEAGEEGHHYDKEEEEFHGWFPWLFVRWWGDLSGSVLRRVREAWGKRGAVL